MPKRPPAPVAVLPTLAEQKADFTAEGSPPPGKVATAVPTTQPAKKSAAKSAEKSAEKSAKTSAKTSAKKVSARRTRAS